MAPGREEILEAARLGHVDPKHRRLTAYANGQEHVFAYDDRTYFFRDDAQQVAVLGVTGQVSSLTRLRGAPVSVRYRQDGETKRATRISVQHTR